MRSDIVLVVPADVAGEQLALSTQLGVPLFLRNALVLAEAGHRRFVCVAGEHVHRQILRLWQQYALPRGLHLSLLTHAQAVSPALAPLTAAHCALLSATTVVTARWAVEVLPAALDGLAPLDAAGVTCLASDATAISTAIADLAQQPVTAIQHRFCHITHANQAPLLEHFLCEEIRLGKNGAIARNINKRMSLPISRVLARARIHPHIITICNLIVGLSAGVGAAGVLYISLLNGSLLLQLASILDGCDGEVARLTHRTSPFGKTIDYVSDIIAIFSFFVGLIIHEYRVGPDGSALFWGTALIGGIALMISLIIHLQRRKSSAIGYINIEDEYIPATLRTGNHPLALLIRAVLILFKKEWYSLAFMCMGLLGILPYALYGTALCVWGMIGLIAWTSSQPAKVVPVSIDASTVSAPGTNTDGMRHHPIL